MVWDTVIKLRKDFYQCPLLRSLGVFTVNAVPDRFRQDLLYSSIR